MSGRRGSAQRGSALMLMPAGVLVMLLLGGIAFDLSLVFLRQRQASSVAVDVANDLASLALDATQLRASGDFVLDADRAEQLGLALLDRSDLADAIVRADIDVLGADAVVVDLEVRVDYVFARAIPGTEDGTVVRATASAVAVPARPG